MHLIKEPDKVRLPALFLTVSFSLHRVKNNNARLHSKYCSSFANSRRQLWLYALREYLLSITACSNFHRSHIACIRTTKLFCSLAYCLQLWLSRSILGRGTSLLTEIGTDFEKDIVKLFVFSFYFHADSTQPHWLMLVKCFLNYFRVSTRIEYKPGVLVRIKYLDVQYLNELFKSAHKCASLLVKLSYRRFSRLLHILLVRHQIQ